MIGGIVPVTTASSICSDNNGNDYEEAFPEEYPCKKRKSNKKNSFKKMEEKKKFAFSNLCMKDAYYKKGLQYRYSHLEHELTPYGCVQTSS